MFDSILKAIPIVGDVLSGVGAIAGAVSQHDANEDNAAAQREFAQHGISWKVADAKRAGLHPLYALGGSGATYTPSAQAVDFGAMGQNLSRAASAAEGREIQAAQLRLLDAQTKKTDMETAALASETARFNQAQNQSRPVFESIANDAPVFGAAPRSGAISYPVPRAKPLTEGQDISLTSYAPSYPDYIAGPAKAGFREWKVPGLGSVLLPDAENLAEALESLENPVNQAAIAAANIAHFGPGHWRRFSRFMGPKLYQPNLPNLGMPSP